MNNLRFLLVHGFWSHEQISLGAKANHVWPIYYDFPVNDIVSRRVTMRIFQYIYIFI